MSDAPPFETEPIEQEIHLVTHDDGWVARDVETGITSKGDTRREALVKLDEAVADAYDE